MIVPLPGDDLPLVWVEIGRAAPENEGWVAWIALPGGGNALYRCLTSVAGTAFVTIDLQPLGRPQARRLHSGQCPVPPDPTAAHTSIAGLLDQADKAVLHALAGQGQQPRVA